MIFKVTRSFWFICEAEARTLRPTVSYKGSFQNTIAFDFAQSSFHSLVSYAELKNSLAGAILDSYRLTEPVFLNTRWYKRGLRKLMMDGVNH